ncbi:hypothetical protein [Corynebacterium sp. A21]|uniref:hypothetical protein n=1 Tax=Corynebacterium sp. A21 TaxID=3457318 RepID=UPI003FCF1378
MNEKSPETTHPTSGPANRAIPFLAAFNEIEQHLRHILQAKKSDGFSWMVRQAHRRHLLRDPQSEALQAFADLRNAISHGTYRDNRPIAEPLPETVAEISRIRDLLLDPPLALSVLGPHQVRSFAPDDDVREALHIIRVTKISQFPIYQGETFLALLTTNTIARWVAADLDDNDHLDARTIEQVLAFAEDSDAAVFLPREVTAREVIDALTAVDPEGALPRAVLLTEHGRRDQRPIRVIGGSDVALLLDAVE